MRITRRDLSQNRASFSVSNPAGQTFTFQIDVKLLDGGTDIRLVDYSCGGGRRRYLGVFNVEHNKPERDGILRATQASPRDPLSMKAAEVFSWVAHRILWTGDPGLPPGYKVVNHRQSLPDVITKPNAIAVWERVIGKQVVDFGDGVYPEAAAQRMLADAQASDNSVMHDTVMTTDGDLYLGTVDPIASLSYTYEVL